MGRDGDRAPVGQGPGDVEQDDEDLRRQGDSVPVGGLEHGGRGLFQELVQQCLELGVVLRRQRGSWVDEDAHRAYDVDREHNWLRRDVVGPVCTDIARVQLVVATP